MQEGHRNAGLATADRADRSGTAARIIVDVPMHALEQLEGLVLAEDLHESRDGGIRGARGVRVGHLHFIAIDRIGEIGPAFRLGQFTLGQNLWVVADPQRAGVDADGVILRLLRLAHRPLLQL